MLRDEGYARSCMSVYQTGYVLQVLLNPTEKFKHVSILLQILKTCRYFQGPEQGPPRKAVYHVLMSLI